ncbi:hypothetical protein ERX27_01600 [Macrococcus brunensis]|uniref:Uncharacterized protein n=1 Tax=Macrococcus brunensis TaxID=198483 RepID=A0A4R6BG27_9STAP|nr:hypothetical protein [Macrococcus brunensis]TDL98815.1 hypothetical protein ERX27_01600 [Macrococcus brunensis]
MVISLIITGAVMLFPLKIMILTFDPGFINEFTGGWNHRIREMIQEERISYSQGMLLIFNYEMTVSVMRRAVLGLSIWLVSLAAVLITALNVIRKSLLNILLVVAIVISLPLVIVPVLLIGVLIVVNMKKSLTD